MEWFATQPKTRSIDRRRRLYLYPFPVTNTEFTSTRKSKATWYTFNAD